MKSIIPIKLDEASQTPVKQQICDQIIESIVSLKLMPGQMLPSSRELAISLDISRATVVRAYKDLTAQGYIETLEGRGTFVRKRILAPVTEIDNSVSVKLSQFADHISVLKPERLAPHDFPELNHGASPTELLPLPQWKLALTKAHSFFQKDLKLIDFASEPFGYLPLRQAILNYINRSTMIECSVDNLIVCSSSVYLLELVAELLVDPGTLVAYPEPGPILPRDIFNKLGANLIPIAVDEKGIKVEDLVGLSKIPSVVYLNPSHQEPTGVCLSMERRRELLNWANTNSVVLIEDDFDSQFRYAGARQAPLRALSANSNVIYLSGFWRTMFPLVNLSYMVIPDILIPVLKQSWNLTQSTFHTHLPLYDEKAIEIFLDGGEYEKHLLKSNAILASRWRSCIHQLTVHFGKSIEISPESSSYHLFLRFVDKTLEEKRILEAAAQANFAMLSGSNHYMFDEQKNVFLVPFAYLGESEMEQKMAEFKNKLELC